MFESLQGHLIFGRTRAIRPLSLGPHAGRYRIDAHRLERPDGAVLEGWSSTPLAAPALGTLLYFGGRNENVVWAPDMASFNPGWAIHAFNYRGFGGSSGRVRRTSGTLSNGDSSTSPRGRASRASQSAIAVPRLRPAMTRSAPGSRAVTKASRASASALARRSDARPLEPPKPR